VKPFVPSAREGLYYLDPQGRQLDPAKREMREIKHFDHIGVIARPAIEK
jgi:hypothetical protein